MKLLGHDISTTQLLGAGVLGYLFVSQGFGNLSTHQQQAGIIAQQRQQDQTRQAALLVSEQQSKALEKIANDRYDRGCEMVFAFSPDGRLSSKTTSITEGQPVLDGVRKTPIGASAIVCDARGMTAKLIPNAQGVPVASELAFTGDRARISAAIRRYRGATYNNSVN